MSTFREPISTEGAANRFREPTSELPDVLSFGSEWQTWLRQYDDERITLSQDDATGLDSECVILDVPTAEALLEVLLDICPNAKALAHNWLLEEQKREYMAGGK